MSKSVIVTQVVNQLSQLSFELQRRVLDFAQALAFSSSKGTPGKELLSFTGIIKSDDLQIMSRAIEDGCEKVNPNEW